MAVIEQSDATLQKLTGYSMINPEVMKMMKATPDLPFNLRLSNQKFTPHFKNWALVSSVSECHRIRHTTNLSMSEKAATEWEFSRRDSFPSV